MQGSQMKLRLWKVKNKLKQQWITKRKEDAQKATWKGRVINRSDTPKVIKCTVTLGEKWDIQILVHNSTVRKLTMAIGRMAEVYFTKVQNLKCAVLATNLSQEKVGDYWDYLTARGI